MALWVVAALMAAIDTAIQSLRSTEILALAEGSRLQKQLIAIAKEPVVYNSSLSLVRTFCETTAAMLVGIGSALTFTSIWFALLVAILVVSLGSYVLVNVSPRALARAYAPQVLRFTAPIARIIRVLFGGFSRGLFYLGSKITPGTGRYLGFRDEEQLLTLVDEAAEMDMLEDDDRELIHSVFEFGDTIVREIMVPRIDMITLDSDETLSFALDQFLNKGVSRIPVIGKDADEVKGVLYLRDLVKHQRRSPHHWQDTLVTELIKPAVFIPESKKTDDTLRQMQRDFNHLALIVDEYGGVAGLVTME
ncbi:MAG: CBS domain-containing protein, partial [Microbacteriaceae bacterium]